MQHIRSRTGWVLAALAALVITLVGLAGFAKPAWAEEPDGKSAATAFTTWAKVKENIDTQNPIWISAAASDASSAIEGGLDINKSVTINIVGAVEAKATPAFKVGGTNAATLTLNISAPSENGEKFTALTLGGITVGKDTTGNASSVVITNSAPKLGTLTMGTSTIINPGSSLTINNDSSGEDAAILDVKLGTTFTLSAGTVAGTSGAACMINKGVTLTAAGNITVNPGTADAKNETASQGARLTISEGATLALVTHSLTIEDCEAKSAVSGSGGNVTINGSVTTTNNSTIATNVASQKVSANDGVLNVGAKGVIGESDHTIAVKNNGTLDNDGTIYGAITNTGICTTSGDIIGTVTNTAGSFSMSDGTINGTAEGIKSTGGSVSVIGGTINGGTGAAVSFAPATAPGEGVAMPTVSLSNCSIKASGKNAGVSVSVDSAITNKQESVPTVTLGSGCVVNGGGAGLSVPESSTGECDININGAMINGVGEADGVSIADKTNVAVNISGNASISAGASGGAGVSAASGAVNITGQCTITGKGTKSTGANAAINVTSGESEGATVTISAPVTVKSGVAPLVNVAKGEGSGPATLVLNTNAALASNDQELTPTVSVGDGGVLTMNGGSISNNDPLGNGVGVSIDKGEVTVNAGTITGNEYAVSFGKGGGNLTVRDNGIVGSQDTPVAVNFDSASPSANVTIDPTKARLLWKNAPFAGDSTGFGSAKVKAYAPYSLGYANEEAYDKAVEEKIIPPELKNIKIDNPTFSDPGMPNQPTPPTGGDEPGGDTPQQPGKITVTFNPNNGGTSTNQTVELEEGEDEATFTAPAIPANPGYVWLGWYNGTERLNSTFTVSQNTTVYGQWAQVNVTLTPTTPVAPGTEAKVTATATLTPVNSSIKLPTGTLPPVPPKMTVTPGNLTATYTPGTTTAQNAVTGTITFTAPTTQPETITVAAAYANATGTGSGYRTTNVYVADITKVNVTANANANGTVTKGTTLNAQGQVAISATPNSGYTFAGWTFTPAQGVTWKPSDSNITLSNPNLNVPTYAGTWTASFQKVTAVPVYRLYNRFNYTHLYTSDTNEIQTLTQGGWTMDFQGRPCWYAPSVQTDGGYKIIRLYNPYNEDHYFVPESDTAQIDMLLDAGMTKDDSSIWSAAANNSNVAVYTLFNPYATVDTHLYTANRDEVDFLVRPGGWRQDSTVIYGIQANQ